MNKARWSKCGECEAPGPCLYQSWGRCPVESTRDPAARERLRAAARRASNHAGASSDVPVETMMRIALCPARESACHCVGKPAVCRRDGPPIEVVCLTAGPDGGPCPGVSGMPTVSGRHVPDRSS